MPKEKTNIGGNIRRYRLKRKLSQEKLAHLAGLSLPTIVKIESGATQNPGLDTAQKIARALGISTDDLIK